MTPDKKGKGFSREASKGQSFAGKKRKFGGNERKNDDWTLSTKKRRVDKSFKTARKGNSFKSKSRNVNRGKAKRK